ncbi:11771_t:CDS:2 [Funneliformis geosporum]|uniref:721_t:CDS:1 n=1 Tax=Funneliformis geosporum TaxID=1117311 RepID=A0A9W4SCG6_9GLOM|nr:11771_t:CDS:2 [Funneliformis geosporum]CAI2164246.1 721_t:CDS:2 [Funneliformis geosporum]
MPSSIYGTIPSHRQYNNYLNRPPFYGYYNGNTSGSDTDDPNVSQQNTYKPGVMRSSLPDMSQYVAQYKKGYPNYGSTNYPYNGWYGDDERLPLFAKPPNYETRQRQSFCTASSSFTAFILFLIVFSYVIYFTSTLPLTDISIIDISDVLAADKELMFNIHVTGRNFGLWDVEIVNSDLNVFATPVNNNNAPGWIPGGPGSHWDDVNNKSSSDVTPSEFLGSILLFDEPIVFAAGVNRKGVVSEPSGQVRLRNPGGENDKEGQDRWSHILRGQYDLTVRGVLKYSLPFSKHFFVRVCYAIRVDGGSGSNGGAQVGDDDDTLLLSNINVILGACGDWEEESEKIFYE